MVVSDNHTVMPDSAKTLNGEQGLSVDRKHRLKHRFEVVKKLGQGTYGKVQLAVNKETGQEVAIKTIKKSKIESEQDLIRIRREIQIMSSVQHPHIIHIYEVFENKEKIVLVMQYASGGELYDYLSEKKVLNDGEARRVFRQIAAAIYYCHKNKICHRDLKLENVLLDERGNAKIADFGLSNVFDGRHLLSTYCGSPLYASPEIVKGTPYCGPEVDCWSMGVLLYTLVYGAMPFDGSNFKRLVKQISDGDYYEPKKKSDASGLIRHLLTVSPTKRANIIDICSDWWVNMGFEHSLLQVAEDTANLTPVRIDLLLALAPVSPPPLTGKENLPSFPKSGTDEGATTSSGVDDCEEGMESHDENGEMTSNSFAYISGGMASEMVSGENPDDIFQEQYGSDDEEFLSAEAAFELDGQCVKRPAEKSFNGSSMMRVSSTAHKSKKPRKSDSSQVSRSSGVGHSENKEPILLENRPEVLGENLEDRLALRKLSSATLVEEEIGSSKKAIDEPKTVAALLPEASVCVPEIPAPTLPETPAPALPGTPAPVLGAVAPVPETSAVVLETLAPVQDTPVPVPEAMMIVEELKPLLSEQNKSAVEEMIIETVMNVAPEETKLEEIKTTPKKKMAKTEQTVTENGTSPTSPKEKKVKRKIVSKKAAAEKSTGDIGTITATVGDQTPPSDSTKIKEKSPEKIIEEIRSLAEKSKAKSPEKITKTTETTIAQSPIEKSRAKSPDKPRPKSPEKSRAESPEKNKSKTEKTGVKSGLKSRELSPAKARSKSPEKGKAKSPEKIKMKTSETTSSLAPSKTNEPTSLEDKKDLKKSGTTPGRIIIRRRSEASPDNNEAAPKPTLGGGSVRRPGKLVMPRFLDTTSPAQTPKANAEPKKLHLPMRSVSDAKKAFEVKKADSTVVQAQASVKKNEVKTSSAKEAVKTVDSSCPVDDTQTEVAKTSVEGGVPVAEQSKVKVISTFIDSSLAKEETSNAVESKPTTQAEVLIKTNTEAELIKVETELIKTKAELAQTKLEAEAELLKQMEDAELIQTKTDVELIKPTTEAELTKPSTEITESSTSIIPAKSKSELDEEKKLAAKSILKKSIAKARLADRKLSQQSSMDSDTGSQCTTPPISTVPVTSVLPNQSLSSLPATTHFKTPQPYLRTQSDGTAQSTAEIRLEHSRNENKPSEEETIWGTPMSPPSSGFSDQKLKRSVLSTSVESDMDNWKHEIEESLKRLSPEGAAEEAPYHSQNSVDSETEGGPTPITRSYKKFTFTKDGSCITETGEVYTKPSPDGTWTKVEKKTKVTTQQPKPPAVVIKPIISPPKPSIPFEPTRVPFEPTRVFRDASPLRHSDSQSSSGSNDIFDDIFDSWTGDSMFSNLLKMNSAFNRFTKDSLKRHDKRRTSLRRPRPEEKAKVWTANQPRGGHSTDRESSDNEDDFDFHFDGTHPVSYGSQGLSHFMKSMNKDFNHQLRAFKDRHGNYSRSLSRDRGDLGSREFRGRGDTKPGSTYSTMTRSASRDRAESPRASETVLRFVIDPPKRQTSLRSEPRSGRLYNDSFGSRERLSGKDSSDRDSRFKESGMGSSWDGYNSDRTTKYTSPLDSPDSALDPSFYAFRPKAFQKPGKNWSKDAAPDSPLTPQSTRSGPELYDRARTSVDALADNRRRRVERWLETNPEGSLEKLDPENLYARTTRSLLSDVPEFATLHDHPLKNKTGFMKYSRSSTDKLNDFEDLPSRLFNMESNQRSRSQADLEQHPAPRKPSYVSEPGGMNDTVKTPMFRTISQIQVSNKFNGSQESLDRGQPEEGSTQSRHSSISQPSGSEIPPSSAEKKPPRTARSNSQNYGTYTRSSSNLSQDVSIEMESPTGTRGSNTPVLRMRVSFNPPTAAESSTSRVSSTKDSQVWPSSSSLWNQELPAQLRSEFEEPGSSLLEALKAKGYRNVMSQRMFRDPNEEVDPPSPGTEPESPKTADRPPDNTPSDSSRAEQESRSTRAESSGGKLPTKRGKDSLYDSGTPAEKERDACCMMETNTPDYTTDHSAAVITNGVNGHSRATTNGHSNEHKPRRSASNPTNGVHRRKLHLETRHRDDVSDGTLTPDSLDSSKGKLLPTERISSVHVTPSLAKPSKNYEEESVSERILRKSFYSRFNEDKPRRKSSAAKLDNDYFLMQELRGGLWSRFSEPDSPTDDLLPPATRRNPRRSVHTTPEKRSSANIEELLEEKWLRNSESRSSSLYDDYLSDDGAWASKPPLPSTRRPYQLNGTGCSAGRSGESFFDKPGSLWNQRRDSSSSRGSNYKEPSVIDTVPDLGERRRSSRSSFSFYSPTVTPKSPVFTSRSIVGDGPEVETSVTATVVINNKERKHSLVEPKYVVLEESRSRQNSGGGNGVSVAFTAVDDVDCRIPLSPDV